MHIDEIIEERCFGSSNKTVYVCWTSRPIWAWEGQLGLAVTMQDAGVSGAGAVSTVIGKKSAPPFVFSRVYDVRFDSF